MMSARSTLFRLLEFCERRSYVVLSTVAAVTIVFAVFALRIEIDPEVLRLLPQDAEVTAKIERNAGKAKDINYLLILLSASDPFTLEGLRAMDEATRTLDSLEPTTGTISPLNLVTFEHGASGPVFRTLSDNGLAPATAEELREYRQRVLSDPIARELVVSDDGKSLALIVAVTIQESYRDFLADVSAVVSDLEQYYTVRLAGWIPLHETTRRYIVHDPPKLVAVAIFATMAILFLAFRTLRAILLPMLTVSLAVTLTLGSMSMLGIPLTAMGVVVPALLFALCNSYGVHILNEYYRGNSSRGAASTVTESILRVSRTVVIACLTTALGFASLMFTSIPRMRELGLFACIGVLLSGVLALVLYPAILVHLQTPQRRYNERVRSGALTRLVRLLGIFITRFRFVVVASLVLLIIPTGIALKNLRFETNYTSYYRESEVPIQDNRFYMEHFGSFVTLNITLSAPSDTVQYFADPEVLRQVAEFESRLRADKDVSSVTSFVTYLKAMMLATSGEFELPESRGPAMFLLRAANMLNGAAREFVRTYIGDGFDKLTISIAVFDGDKRWFLTESGLRALVARIEQSANSTLPDGTTHETWSWGLVALELSKLLTRDQSISTAIAAAFVLLVSSLAFRSIRYGLLALIPMASGVALTFIFLWVASIPLDILTIMFTSIAIGVGVDDSVHLLMQFRFDESRSLSGALERAGRPIILTSVAIIVGLLATTFSKFVPVIRFGVIMAFSMLATTLGALIILPAILAVVSRPSPNRSRTGVMQ